MDIRSCGEYQNKSAVIFIKTITFYTGLDRRDAEEREGEDCSSECGRTAHGK